jgi:hypothetical protein
MRKALLLALCVVRVAAQSGGVDPRLLSAQGQQLLFHGGDRAQGIALLRQAIAGWEKVSEAKDPTYAEALTVLAAALEPSLAQNKAELTTQVLPLMQKAVAIRDQNPAAATDDVAVTLELDALVLKTIGREDEAGLVQVRARQIRSKLVERIQPTFFDDDNPIPLRSPGVKMPRLINRKEPELTDIARLLKMQSAVVLGATLGVDGIPRHIEVFRAAGFGLDERAIEAFSQWRFTPATRDDVPVAVEATIQLSFH